MFTFKNDTKETTFEFADFSPQYQAHLQINHRHRIQNTHLNFAFSKISFNSLIRHFRQFLESEIPYSNFRAFQWAGYTLSVELSNQDDDFDDLNYQMTFKLTADDAVFDELKIMFVVKIQSKLQLFQFIEFLEEKWVPI